MTLPWTPTKGAKTKRMAEARLRQLLFQATYADDDSFLDLARRQIPESWHTLEMDLDVDEPKEKVTLYLDRSVARMFRTMGKGYHARINRVLATWVQMKMAEKVGAEIRMLDQIAADAAEKRRSDDCSVLGERRKTLQEHWAYAQGVLDAEVPPLGADRPGQLATALAAAG
jgi:uncharacterized protein (DUF4415 family)